MFNKTNGLNQPAADSTKKAVTTPINRTNTMTSPSILAADLVITGDIKTEGDVQIDGRIEGNITAGNITVGEQGAVNGTVIAQSIHVRGKLTGEVDAAKVELSETANVKANLTQDQLMIANGAFFDGKCIRKNNAKKSVAKAAE